MAVIQSVDQIARVTFLEFEASTALAAGTVERDLVAELTFLDLLENEVLIYMIEQGIVLSGETVTTSTKAAAWNWNDGTLWSFAEWG